MLQVWPAWSHRAELPEQPQALQQVGEGLKRGRELHLRTGFCLCVNFNILHLAAALAHHLLAHGHMIAAAAGAGATPAAGAGV